MRVRNSGRCRARQLPAVTRAHPLGDRESDALIVATPVYKASYTGLSSTSSTLSTRKCSKAARCSSPRPAAPTASARDRASPAPALRLLPRRRAADRPLRDHGDFGATGELTEAVTGPDPAGGRTVWQLAGRHGAHPPDAARRWCGWRGCCRRGICWAAALAGSSTSAILGSSKAGRTAIGSTGR